MKRRIFAAIALLTAGMAFAQTASLDDAAPCGMVRVEGGTFTMGSAALFDDCCCFRAEMPARSVTVSGFWMGRFLVTQGEWYDVMGTNPSHFQGDMVPARTNWRNLPVESVSWLDAVEFANAKSLRAGLTPAYAISGTGASRVVSWNCGANGYRLPTEAEWEFAARGGMACRGNFEFSGSNVAGEVAWYRENSGGGTQPVRTLRPNALGIYDMSGNVWEWVWDLWGPYPSVAQTDPAGASSGSFRVLRGGSWGNSAAIVRCAFRVGDAPWGRGGDLGFRLVRSAD